MSNTKQTKRLESKQEVETYLDRLLYAIQSGSVKITFLKERDVDKKRNRKYTNRYTMSQLFPDEDEVEAIKRELTFLCEEEYIETVKDLGFPQKSEMRVFGRKYLKDDVYIKIRVELINIDQAYGDAHILVISFHYAEWDFRKTDFPYRKG